MSESYVGEIRIFAGNYAPQGWALCDGSLLAISEFSTLFNLIGTTYGGDGQSTFALPDLRSRVPVHSGSGFTLGQTGGTETVTITTSEIPAHSHAVIATTSEADNSDPTDRLPATHNYGGDPVNGYKVPDINTVSVTATSTGNTGGSLPHSNIQPFVAVNFIISLFGVYPSQ
jgi:microcystin-dependent protein